MTRTYELYFFEFELRHPKSWPNLMCFPLRFWEHSAHSTNWNCGGAIVTSRSLLDMVMRLHGNWKYTQIQNKAHQTFDHNIIMLISDCTNASSSHGLWIAIHSAVTSFSLVATVAQQANESTFSPGISPRIANVPIVLAREKQQIQKQLNWYPTPQDETTMCCHASLVVFRWVAVPDQHDCVVDDWVSPTGVLKNGRNSEGPSQMHTLWVRERLILLVSAS